MSEAEKILVRDLLDAISRYGEVESAGGHASREEDAIFRAASRLRHVVADVPGYVL